MDQLNDSYDWGLDRARELSAQARVERQASQESRTPGHKNGGASFPLTSIFPGFAPCLEKLAHAALAHPRWIPQTPPTQQH